MPAHRLQWWRDEFAGTKFCLSGIVAQIKVENPILLNIDLSGKNPSYHIGERRAYPQIDLLNFL